MYETGGETRVDAVVVVMNMTSPEIQRDQILSRENMTSEKLDAIPTLDEYIHLNHLGQKQQMALRKMHRRKGVLDHFGFSNSTLYARIADGSFPPPVKIGPKMVGWYDDELQAFQRGEWHRDWKPAAS